LRDLPENEHVHMIYDEGTLEMMRPSWMHGRYASLIDYLLFAWAEERGIDIENCGSMTCKREDLQRGFEPDNCYYVANEALVRQKKELDFAVDPPPDLAIEIDLGRGGRRKLAIYAQFRVPEVWWFDGHALEILVLSAENKYSQRLTSLAFPDLPPQKLESVLETMGMESETALVRSFRDWVRTQQM
jgi:Uma2 family endonuclease